MTVFRCILLSTLGLIMSLSAESLKADPANDLYTLAQFAYQKAHATKNKEKALEEYAYAEKRLDAFLSKYTKHEKSANAFFLLATCQSKQGKKREALISYVALLKRTHEGPKAGAAALQLGIAQYEEQQYESATEYLQLALSQLSPSASRSFGAYVKALSHQKLQQDTEYEAALDLLLSSKDGKKYHNRAYFKKGELALKAEDYPAAYQYFQKCTNDPDLSIRAQAVHKCAILAQKLGDTRAANSYFRRVLQTPSLSEVHSSTALILMNVAAAAEKWQDILPYEKYGEEGLSDPQIHQRLLLLAKSYDKRGDQKNSQKYFSKLAEVSVGTETGFEVSYRQLSVQGTENVSLTSIEEFLAIYTEEFHQDPRYESVKLLHAEKLYQEQRYEEALAAYQRIDISKISEDNIPTIAYRLCKISLEGNYPEQSIPYIDQFIEQYPNDLRGAYLTYDKAVLLSTAGKNAESIQSFTTVINHQKSNKELLKPSWLYIAQLSVQEKNFPAAIAAYDSLLLKHSQGTPKEELAEWAFWSAYCHHKTEDLKSAKSNFLNVRSLDKNVKPIETTRHLALIAFSEKDTPSLKQEVSAYDKLGQTPLPTSLYLYLAIEESKEKDWHSAWHYFERCISPENTVTDELISTVILEKYAETAIETGNYREARSATTYLKTENLSPYRKAVNLYRSALSHYNLTGANDAETDVTAALNINPKGRLRHQLLLLHGKVEIDRGNTDNGKRVLVRVKEFAGSDNKDLKKDALLYLIKAIEQNTTPDGHNKLKLYQKELELLR